jgi:hypothetical protein
VNLETGEPGKQPSKILMKDSWRRVDPGAKFHACFGMNSISASPGGFSLAVGDQVSILSTTSEHDRKKGMAK